MMLGIDGNDQLVNFLVDLLQSESTPARRGAARALRIAIRPLPDAGRPAVPGPAAVDRLAVESLTAALRDLDALVRIHAAAALRAFSGPASLPALLPMLQDPEEEVRFAAVHALMDALADPSRAVRERAAVALGSLGDPGPPPPLSTLWGRRTSWPRNAGESGRTWSTHRAFSETARPFRRYPGAG